MRKTLVIIFFLTPVLLSAQQDSIISGVYEWKQPVRSVQKNIKSFVLFEGSTYDMQWLQMNGVELAASKTANKMSVPANEEHLYIVKNGTLTITISDSVNVLVPGSISLLLPGQNFLIQNKNAEPCEYYVMKYRSKKTTDMQRGKDSGGSFTRDWNKILFKPNSKGGTRSFFQRPTAMTQRLEMHVTTLNAGLKSHDPHTHRATEIVIMIDGDTEMQIEQKVYKGKQGDVYYLGSNVLHGIRNIGSKPSTYFAFQFQ